MFVAITVLTALAGSGLERLDLLFGAGLIQPRTNQVLETVWLPILLELIG